MAASKASYRKNNDRFLTYMVVGFAGAILALILGLVIYNIVTEELDYDSFDHVTSYQAITSQQEDQYLVYFYSENCGYCQQIKDRVLTFADENSANIKVYLLDAASATGVNNVTDPTSGTSMTGTPSIIMVDNGVIVEMAPGYVNVLDTINEINAGTYDYLD